MESSYQTISRLPMTTTIANIISSSKSSPSFPKSTSSSSLQPNDNGTAGSLSPTNRTNVRSNVGNGNGHHNIHYHLHHRSSHNRYQHSNSFQQSSTSHPVSSNRSVEKPLSINLSSKGLVSEQLLQLSRKFPSQANITTLKLGYNNFGDEGAEIIASFLQKNISVTCLDLGFCNIEDKGTELLANSLVVNQTLKILYLSGNLISAKGFSSLGNALALNKSLQTLYLTGNSGAADGVKALSKGLKFNMSLQRLYLNGNRIDSDGTSSLSDTLLTNYTITCLNLSDNNIGDAGLLSLSEALANHRNLQELELSFNRISPIGMGSFIDSLIGYLSLQRLLLDNNKLGDAGAKSLALALSHMNLVELNIGFNEISADGLLAVIGSITNNKTLAVLALSGNVIDNNVAKALANFLVKNSVLRTLHIDRSNLSTVAERYIATGIASNCASGLQILTGFELGKVLHLLGSPAVVCDMGNEQALNYLNHMWRTVEKSKQMNVAASGNVSVPPGYQYYYQGWNTNNTYYPNNGTFIPSQAVPSLTYYSLPLPGNGTVALDKGTIIGMAKSLKDMPFNNADLWALYQYFYTPPVSMMEPNGMNNYVEAMSRNYLSAPNSHTGRHDQTQDPTTHDRPYMEDSSRPMKKPVNKFTVSRISNYQHIKNLLEEYISNYREEKSLLILRQLKFLEDYLKLEPMELENFYLDKVFEP